MKHYLIVKRQSLASKNRFHDAVEEYLRTVDRRVVSLDQIHHFIDVLNARIDEIHGQFPRCAPLERFVVSSFDMRDAQEKEIADFVFSVGSGQFSLICYQIRQQSLGASESYAPNL